MLSRSSNFSRSFPDLSCSDLKLSQLSHLEFLAVPFQDLPGRQPSWHASEWARFPCCSTFSRRLCCFTAALKSSCINEHQWAQGHGVDGCWWPICKRAIVHQNSIIICHDVWSMSKRIVTFNDCSKCQGSNMFEPGSAPAKGVPSFRGVGHKPQRRNPTVRCAPRSAQPSGADPQNPVKRAKFVYWCLSHFVHLAPCTVMSWDCQRTILFKVLHKMSMDLARRNYYTNKMQ